MMGIISSGADPLIVQAPLYYQES
jgi:hypothetical protein